MPERPNQPVMHDFDLLILMHDGQRYRANVSAQTLEDACREIIHVQMAKGLPVRRINVMG